MNEKSVWVLTNKINQYGEYFIIADCFNDGVSVSRFRNEGWFILKNFKKETSLDKNINHKIYDPNLEMLGNY